MRRTVLAVIASLFIPAVSFAHGACRTELPRFEAQRVEPWTRWAPQEREWRVHGRHAERRLRHEERKERREEARMRVEEFRRYMR